MNESITKLGRWTGIVGTITIVTGIIQAIAGLFAFVIGAVPGIIQIVLGVKLLSVKKSADEMDQFHISEPSNQVDAILSNLSTYFMIQGILLIVSLVLQVFAMIFR